MTEQADTKTKLITGLYCPDEYPQPLHFYLSRLLATYTDGYAPSAMYKQQKVVPLRHLIHAVQPQVKSRNLPNSVIIALDANHEIRYGLPHNKVFDRLYDLKETNPDLKTIIWYANNNNERAEHIINAPSFAAAASNNAVDLIYTDVPLKLTFNTEAGAPVERGFGAHPTGEFRKVLQALVENRFEGRMRSPHLVEAPERTLVEIGDMVIDRARRRTTMGGRTLPISGHAATILGTLGAYRGSWVSSALMMSNLYTPEQLEQDRGLKILDVYKYTLKKKFEIVGTGKIENLHGEGSFIRPSDFKMPRAAP